MVCSLVTVIISVRMIRFIAGTGLQMVYVILLVKINKLDLSGINTSREVDTEGMFQDCSSAEIKDCCH